MIRAWAFLVHSGKEAGCQRSRCRGHRLSPGSGGSPGGGDGNRSSTLTWRIPRTEESGGLGSIGSQSQTRLSHWSTHMYIHVCMLSHFRCVQLKHTHMYIHVCMLSRFSRVRLCATLWTVAHQAPLSMGFSRQEYWSGLPCPPPGELGDPGIKPASFMSPALASRFFTTSVTWEAMYIYILLQNKLHRKHNMIVISPLVEWSWRKWEFGRDGNKVKWNKRHLA